MLSLRGHHLVCLHFFTGEGYDEAFIINLRNIMTRADDEDITITSVADDVCISCLHLREGRCAHTEDADADIREMDKKALDLLNLSDTGQARWDELRDPVRKIFPEWYSLYCSECDWREACEKNVFFREMLKNKASLQKED
jgi:hypothetical protein